MQQPLIPSPATQALLGDITDHFAAMPQVAAVALAGSLTAATADTGSDLDIYIYCRAEVPLEKRAGLSARRAVGEAEIGNNDFGAGDEWTDRATGSTVDLMYFGTLWIEGELDRVLVRHQPSLGYTTAFWATLRRSLALYDCDGWLANMLARAAAPYPEALRQAIVRKNHPLLRDRQSSYLHQLEKAVARQDRVSVNHRTAALLASYFDILFALNRVPHPGEKRLMHHIRASCPLRPEGVEQQVEALLLAQAAPLAQATPGEESSLLQAANALIDGLDALLRRDAWL